MDRHGYFGGPHEGKQASFMLSKGDRYDDASALLFGGKNGPPADDKSLSLPIMDVVYNGKPSIITEIGWTMPNRYRADLPLLAATYGVLQNSDGFFFFATGSPGWQGIHSKFPLMTPVIGGQFPAAALIYRKGLVKPGEKVVEAQLKLSDLFALKGSPVAAPQNMDDFRTKDVPAGKAVEVKQVSSIDPLAFLVGQVEIDISETGGTSKVMDLSKFIDRNKKQVTSSTRELVWDYQGGLLTVNAPSAQGVTGFLSKAGEVKLGDVTFQSDMEYGALILVPLDDQPLKTSKKMLLQVMSEDTNYGWSAPGEGKRAISDLGGPPIVVKKFSGTVSLTRPGAGTLKATPLDFNGYPISGAAPLPADKINLLDTTLYYLIEK